MEKREGKPVRHLVLVPEGEANTLIIVPEDKLEQIGVREVISEKTADHLLDTFSQAATGKLSTDKFKRQRIYQDILKGESLDNLAALIRELATNPKLCFGDKELLSRAQKRLFSEIALVKGLGFQRIVQIAQTRMAETLIAN